MKTRRSRTTWRPSRSRVQLPKPCAHGIRQRTTHDLRFIDVRRQVHIGRGEIVEEIRQRQIPVDHHYVLAQAGSGDALLQLRAVTLGFVLPDDGMRCSEYHVQKLRMTAYEKRDCVDCRFEALAPANQAEGAQDYSK